jgi:S-adenosylmethionine:tRNA ribosyltransferase-isomerase
MHAEYIQVTHAAIETIIQHLGKPIIPVGTTSLRTIESLYWLGLKTMEEPGIAASDLIIQQWDAYKENVSSLVPAKEALQSLQKWMISNQLDTLFTKTQLLIAPGYIFRIISALITNFHQPQSTLLLIIGALTGKNWKSIYNYALAHEFRFLSYGDGSLLFPDDEEKM